MTMNKISVCNPGNHIWKDIKSYDDGTKLQRCKLCGKTRRVDNDTPED